MKTNTQNQKVESQQNGYTLHVYGLDQQARGAFDGGRIRETKPIGFPREGSVVRRVGPLFYWAWAVSDAPAIIGMHPHQGFEILSYVIRGELGHKDTGGNERVLGEGGLQVMQTASGISHEEQMVSPDGTEFFQIWFEPDMRETVNQPAVYRDFTREDFPHLTEQGNMVEHLIGELGTMELETDARIRRIVVSKDQSHRLEVAGGRALALVVLKGKAVFETGESAGLKDFVVIKSDSGSAVSFAVNGDGDFEALIVDVPQTVDYPLYGE